MLGTFAPRMYVEKVRKMGSEGQMGEGEDVGWEICLKLVVMDMRCL